MRNATTVSMYLVLLTQVSQKNSSGTFDFLSLKSFVFVFECILARDDVPPF